MSNVQKDKRKDGKLTLPILARNHAKWVIQITKNAKWFPPEYNHTVTDEIVLEAKNIHRHIWTANNILVRSPETYRDRRREQEKAAMLCNDLLADIEIAATLFHLRGKRVKYWTAAVVEIRNRTRAWIDSDADRYKQYR